jgi:hypothetical protein
MSSLVKNEVVAGLDRRFDAAGGNAREAAKPADGERQA